MEAAPAPARGPALGALGVGNGIGIGIGVGAPDFVHHHRSPLNHPCHQDIPHYQPVPREPGPRTRAPVPRPIHIPSHNMPPVTGTPRDSPHVTGFYTSRPFSPVAHLHPSLSSRPPSSLDERQSTERPPQAFQAYQPFSRSGTPSGVRAPSSSESQTSQSSTRPTYPIATGVDFVGIDNFSRPRNVSRKRGQQQPTVSPPPQSQLDFLSPRSSTSPDDGPLDSMSLHTWSRGPSVSSAMTTSTFASAPLSRSAELRERLAHSNSSGNSYGSLVNEPRQQHHHQHPPASGLPLAAGTRESVFTMATPAKAASGSATATATTAPLLLNDARSGRRSQLMAAAESNRVAQRERASMLIRNGLLDTLVPPLNELSVEDVMSLYESGFNDTEPEDHDAVADDSSRPQTAWSAPNRASRSMLAAALTIEASEGLSAEYDAEEATAGGNAVDHDPNHDSNHNHDDDDDNDDDGYEPETEEPPLPLTLTSATATARSRHSRLSRQSLGRRLSIQPPPSEHPSLPLDQPEMKRDSGKSFEPEPSPSSTLPKLPPEAPGSRDRYGFKKENQYVTRAQYDAWNATYEPYLDRRRRKWIAYLKENSLMTSRPNRFPAKNSKTKRFVRKGIPPEWRGAAWFYYAGGPALLAKNQGVYDRLVRQEAKDVDMEAIERDLHRTFPDNVRFKPPQDAGSLGATDFDSEEIKRQDAPPGPGPEIAIISSLRRVLLAFSIHNPRIGYCQSLNFLAGLLLLFVESEEHAFWLLNIITQDFLPGTHELSLEGSKVDLGVLMTCLHESMPAVWAKIAGDMDAEPAQPPPAGAARPQTGRSMRRTRVRQRDVPAPTGRLPPITLCMTAWFMSCFIGTLPIETTLRVWDVLFYEGSKTLFRIALAIFKLGENEIESMLDPMEMFSVVQTIPRKMLDANALVEACFRRRNGFGHLSQDTTDERRRERRAQVQLEKNGTYDGARQGRRGGDDDEDGVNAGGTSSARTSKGSSIFARRKRTVEVGVRRPIDE